MAISRVCCTPDESSSCYIFIQSKFKSTLGAVLMRTLETEIPNPLFPIRLCRGCFSAIFLMLVIFFLLRPSALKFFALSLNHDFMTTRLSKLYGNAS